MLTVGHCGYIGVDKNTNTQQCAGVDAHVLCRAHFVKISDHREDHLVSGLEGGGDVSTVNSGGAGVYLTQPQHMHTL